jgi:hypothetical protein
MMQSCWEANIHLVDQEILFLLWNPKVNCLIHKYPKLDSYPKPHESSPYLVPYLFKVDFNTILPYMLKSPKCDDAHWIAQLTFYSRMHNAYM